MTGFAQRRAALAPGLEGLADAGLVTNLINVRYLTGFTGSNGAVLVRADGTATLATDARYAVQAADEAPDVDLTITRALLTDLLAQANAEGLKSVAVEHHVLTVETYQRLTEVAEGMSLPALGRVVDELRIVKDDGEMASLRRACAVTDLVFGAVLPQLRPGVTELDIAWALRSAMHEHGAEPAFESIVAFGPNSAQPHHRPTERPLERGDFVKLDFGARVDGYHADMTRTVAVGPVADWQSELHDLVRDIQSEARAAVQAGALPEQLDELARKRIEDAGHETAHGLGHGVGLEIHELPFLVPGTTAAKLAESVPVTVEPGVYLPGRGGVRIEDTVVVGADGAESLTTSPRELIVL